MIIACLKENPSNDFYKHIGGKYIKDRVYKRLNLPENVYYYEIQIVSEEMSNIEDNSYQVILQY